MVKWIDISLAKRLETAGGLSIKAYDVAFAGTTYTILDENDARQEIVRTAAECDVHFFASPPVEYTMYTVPWVDLFAHDGHGGVFGSIGAEFSAGGVVPICWLPSNGECYLISSCAKTFLHDLKNWRGHLIPWSKVYRFANGQAATEKFPILFQFDDICGLL